MALQVPFAMTQEPDSAPVARKLNAKDHFEADVRTWGDESLEVSANGCGKWEVAKLNDLGYELSFCCDGDLVFEPE